MFELPAGTLDRPFCDKHAGLTTFSVAAHVVVLGSVIAAGLFAVVELPKVPTMMAFVAELQPPAPPPPPPPPPAPARPKREAQPPRPAPPPGPTLMVPAEVPAGVQPELAFDTGDEGGVVGGVPGGVPGGVVQGIPGGIVTEVAPLPPPPKRLVRIGGNIKEPTLVHRVAPEYPLIAVRAKVTGTVILEAQVNEQGEVTSVEVLRSIPLLDRAALDAVKRWRYEPLLMGGTPAPFILTVTVTFSLKSR